VASDVRLERVTRAGEGVEKLAKSKGAMLKIGILSGTGEHPNADHGQTVAEIAWWNEFGTRNIPERPFLRPALRENLLAYGRIIEAALKAVLTGKLSRDQGLGILGERAKRDVVNKITVLSDPPNAEATIDAKGSSSPLVDTGALRQHINWAKVD
jgi:hypothetical protein